MEYLEFNTKEGAAERSAELWLEKIGRDKVEEDVSCYLYGAEAADADAGGSMLVISDDGDLLTAAEKSALIGEDAFLAWREKHQPNKVIEPNSNQ